MKPDQIAKMQAGKAAKREERRANAELRISAFEGWLKRGSVLREIPQVPSRADYRLARGSGSR